MEQVSRKEFLINTLYVAVIAVFIYIFCKFLLGYLMPFVIAGVVAFSVRRPADILSERLKIKKSLVAGGLALSAYILFLGAVLGLSVGLALAGAGFINEIGGFLTEIGKGIIDIKNKLTEYFVSLPEGAREYLSEILNAATGRITSYAGGLISDFAGLAAKKTPSFLISLVVSAVASVYIAADLPRLILFFKNLFGGKIYGNSVRIKNILINSVLKLLKGYLLLMLITFFELLAGFLILRLNYAVILAAVVAVIDILPVLGVGTVLIPWGILSIISENTSLGVGLLVLYFIILAVRNFAEPKIIGTGVGLHPLFTLILMFLGIKLLGVSGVIIFPLAAIVVIKYYCENN